MRALGTILAIAFVAAVFLATIASGALAFVAQAIILAIESAWRKVAP